MFQNLSAKVRAYIKRHFSFSIFPSFSLSFHLLFCCSIPSTSFLGSLCCLQLMPSHGYNGKALGCIARSSISIFSIAYVFIFCSPTQCMCSVSRDFCLPLLVFFFFFVFFSDFYANKHGVCDWDPLHTHTPIKYRKYTKIRFIVIVFI